MNNFKERGFLDPVSTFNTRKEFRVDPRKQKLDKIKAQQQLDSKGGAAAEK